MKARLLTVVLSLIFLGGCVTSGSLNPSNSLIKSDEEISLRILTEGLDQPPRIKRGKHPAHPMGQGANDGLAVIEFTINENGRTQDLKTIEKQGEGYAGNAKYAIKYWRFYPALKDGKPVSCRVVYAVHYHGRRTNQNFEMD